MLKSKEDILKQVAAFSKAHGIPMDQIAIGGGCAFVLMGVREETADINLWVDDPYFQRLADKQGVIIRAWHDTVVQAPEQTIWVRKRNRYFTTVAMGKLQVFTPLALTVQKRGSYIDHKRPSEKRQQDHKDLVILNDILKEQNKVREVA